MLNSLLNKNEKVYEYIVVLEHKNKKWIDAISIFMLVIALVTFLYASYSFFTQKDSTSLFMFSTIVSGVILNLIIASRRVKTGLVAYYRFALLLAAIGWYKLNFLLIAVSYLLAAVIEKPLKQNPEVAVSDDEIVVNVSPAKRYTWHDVEHIILKDGLLTIGFKNNRFLQHKLDEDVDHKTETEFNTYCNFQLSKYHA